MRTLSDQEAQKVDGGFLELLVAFIAVFTFPKVFNDHREEYAEWGVSISEQYWEHKYPYDPNSNQCYGPHC